MDSKNNLANQQTRPAETSYDNPSSSCNYPGKMVHSIDHKDLVTSDEGPSNSSKHYVSTINFDLRQGFDPYNFQAIPNASKKQKKKQVTNANNDFELLDSEGSKVCLKELQNLTEARGFDLETSGYEVSIQVNKKM